MLNHLFFFIFSFLVVAIFCFQLPGAFVRSSGIVNSNLTQDFFQVNLGMFKLVRNRESCVIHKSNAVIKLLVKEASQWWSWLFSIYRVLSPHKVTFKTAALLLQQWLFIQANKGWWYLKIEVMSFCHHGNKFLQHHKNGMGTLQSGFLLKVASATINKICASATHPEKSMRTFIVHHACNCL